LKPRKRAPGGGRKPKAEADKKSSYFSTRISPEIRRKLDASAKASGRSLSHEIQFRLDDSFGIQRVQNEYLRALFHLMERAAMYLPPNWYEDPWCKRAFKAAAIATLNRIIQDTPSEAPVGIKTAWEAHAPGVALTPEGYGKQLEWAVDIFVQMTPNSVPPGSVFPAGSVVYAIPQVRRDLDIPHNPELSRKLMNNLGEPPEGGQS